MPHMIKKENPNENENEKKVHIFILSSKNE